MLVPTLAKLAMATGEFLPAAASAGDTEQFRQEVEALEAEESEETQLIGWGEIGPVDSMVQESEKPWFGT